MLDLFKKLIWIQGSVSRKFYLLAGISLAIFKYVFEAAVVAFLAGVFYSPIVFLSPSITLRAPLLEVLPESAGWFWIVFSIPFMWVSVTLSIRRSQDAGISPWIGLVVLIPVFNFFIMLLLSLMPTSAPSPPKIEKTAKPAKRKPESTHEKLPDANPDFVSSASAGVGVGMVLALAITFLSVTVVGNYGAALFLGMPLAVGTVSGAWFNRVRRRNVGTSAMVGLTAIFLGGFALLLFGVEGAICLVMAAPLLLPLGALGGVVGHGIANAGRSNDTRVYGALLVVPLMAVVEISEPKTFVVETSVVIEADVTTVWDTVLAFPDITEPPGGMFEWGVAYPVRARIEGQGVGATRYCEFTTGTFVEPVTDWHPPWHLGFDVVEQPDPMVELTPWRHIHPPHLQDSFRSLSGEFRLTELPNGATSLSGSTTYQLKIGPTLYWKIWTDDIVHRIHLRVLNHIRDIAEDQTRQLGRREAPDDL